MAVALSAHQHDILSILYRFGKLSHHGIEHAAKAVQSYRSPSGTRTRVAELVRMGFVKDSGQVEYTPTGRKAILWTVI